MDHARDCWAPPRPDTQSLGRVGNAASWQRRLTPAARTRTHPMRRCHVPTALFALLRACCRRSRMFVELLPRWVAPNLITLKGLGVPLSAAVIYAHQCPAMDDAGARRAGRTSIARSRSSFTRRSTTWTGSKRGTPRRRRRSACSSITGATRSTAWSARSRCQSCAITAKYKDVGTMLGLLSNSVTLLLRDVGHGLARAAALSSCP